jgi:hypothetical protein
VDNIFHDLIPLNSETGSFLSRKTLEDANYDIYPYSMLIRLDSEIKVFKREVYSFLDMIGDIGGLFDGLLIISAFLLSTYNESMFELSLVKNLFKFQQPPASKADLARITQHLEDQKILELPACLHLISKVLCKALLKSEHRSKLKKFERAHREIKNALDIR